LVRARLPQEERAIRKRREQKRQPRLVDRTLQIETMVDVATKSGCEPPLPTGSRMQTLPLDLLSTVGQRAAQELLLLQE
jgi:hypothetical protein